MDIGQTVCYAAHANFYYPILYIYMLSVILISLLIYIIYYIILISVFVNDVKCE